MRYFGMVSVGDKRFESLLNTIIILADPSEKNAAHITVSGPFTKKPMASDVSMSVSGETVSVVGVGQFLNEKQHTIFLECGFPSARSVWNKKNYGFRPHLTLYDGADRQWSKVLYDRIKLLNPFFNFKIGSLHYYKSISGQKDLSIALDINFKFIQLYAPKLNSLEAVSKLSQGERLTAIDEMLFQCGNV